MPEASPSTYSVTTINYTLEWPHLENPSNTTFAGLIQIDECKCGPNNTDLGHLYTRYRCVRPEIRFSPPGDELWVLQAPLGQVNLLRPANDEEHERRKEIYKDAKPTAYAGKNFLLLTGPCPRGRYQAYATLQFLKALSPAARQQVEYLSLLIQPYEEDCSDDQGGRAYIELAQYIRDKVPAFKTLCLNIWGEETRVGSREFGMLLLVEGISISISWDWCSAATDEYTDVSAFLKAIETGVVVNRLAFENMTLKNQQDDDDNGGSYQSHDTRKRSTSEDDWSDTMLTPHDATRTFRQAGSDDNGSDTMLTPLSPQDGDIGEYGSWQVL
ncbi:hypothetical protein GQ44DRAFT_612196 [Phaeosphaeriaceae sp. PMI808]|nr:hypothetical protein GQ44DRAFT_612196 [Phaeosphaeriaceae sp. PMI808]